MGLLRRGRESELDVAAEQKPDFSGEYVLNLQASALGGGASAVRSAVLCIEHREPMVCCQGAFTFDDTNFNYTLERLSDGREVVDGKEPLTTSSLRWVGDSLVFIDRTDAADAPVTMSWRYELDDSGRRLTAVEQIRGGGRDQDNVLGLRASLIACIDLSPIILQPIVPCAIARPNTAWSRRQLM